MTHSIKIGKRVYLVRYQDYVAYNCLGLCEFPTAKKQGRISIKTGQTRIQTADTIIHEILHAICHNKKLKLDDETEEKVVSALASGLTQFIKANPEFAEEVMELINGE